MERAERIKDYLDQALDLSEEQRAGFLAEACGDDSGLRTDIEELILASESAGAFLGGDVELPTAGERVGRYVLLDILGEGGFGVVYRAQQEEPIRREVALKLVRKGMDSRSVLARFEAERQALARMNHPNVAQVLDGGVAENGRPYFVMELVNGREIIDYANHHGLNLSDRLELFVPVARGVQHAHQKGIIHRDLKPSNVLVADGGERPLPKIIDFGIAKAMFEPLTALTLTTAQCFMGTPAYMAPEQALAAGDIDTRADIYSLGALLYELVTGAQPFAVSTSMEGGLAEVLRHIAEVDPPRPSARVVQFASKGHDHELTHSTRSSKLGRELRGGVDWLVMRALEKDRDRRYASAAALAEDIERFLRHEPVIARPPSATYRLITFTRRNRIAVGAGFALFLALSLGLFSTLLEKRRADVHAAEALLERNHVLRLSAFQKLEDLRRAADELWPANASTIEACQKWLVEAQELVSGLDPAPEPGDLGHHGMLAALRSRGKAQGEAGEFIFDDEEDRWWHGQLARLVAEIEAFADPEDGLIAGIGAPYGWGVRRRLVFAEELEEKSISGPVAKERWIAAIDAIAAEPAYAGLALAPQRGLLPIGPDPESGLWEFWHVQSGKEPTRAEDGVLLADEGGGIVLVLIPGGTFLMGAQSHSPGKPSFDPLAAIEEGPPMELTLDPFFIGKFELTQGQWQRFHGNNPSNYIAGMTFGRHVPSLQNPVEEVSWVAAQRALERMELSLPTEAQWEFAARAGADTPWWTGPEREWIEGVANIRDAFVRETGVSWNPVEVWLNDGYVIHAEVGSFAPNPFGLHDVHGNVWEWCRDWMARYNVGAFEPGDGLHLGFASTTRIYRGGSFYQLAREARSSHREGYSPTAQNNDIGLRAGRSIHP